MVVWDLGGEKMIPCLGWGGEGLGWWDAGLSRDKMFRGEFTDGALTSQNYHQGWDRKNSVEMMLAG